MKKIFYILVFSSFLKSANAQTKFGANIGLLSSYSRIENHFASNDTAINRYGSKMGIKIGGFAEFKIGQNWNIVSTINFVHKGAAYYYDSINQGKIEPLTLRIKTNYIELEPVTVLYKSSNMHGLFAGAGPVLGIGIGGKARLRDPGKLLSKDVLPARDILFNGKKNGTNYSDSTFYLWPLEIGAALSLGYELKKSGISFLINFYQSFSNISPDNKGIYRNRYLMLGTRFKF
jgi:hypothetical protein